jgi:hypothetical protein
MISVTRNEEATMARKASGGKKPAPKDSHRAAEDRLRGLFEDFVLAEPVEQGIIAFCRHVGIPLPVRADVTKVDALWWGAFQGHYVTASGSIDEERVAADLAAFPPIAARIAYLRREMHAGA